MTNFDLSFNFCLLLIIVSISILPITFLKSPADFWWAILIAVLCTIITITMIFVDFHDCYHEAHYSGISIDAILGLGIFLFAFNGHQVFPTVQNDMRNPADFKKSVLVGFVYLEVVALLYMPLSAYAFLIYGDSMANSVIDSVQTTWIRYVADLSIAIHLLSRIENCPPIVGASAFDQHSITLQEFCFKRVLVRTSLLLTALFVGMSLPNFGSVMNLFGSTAVPCTCVVLPTLFNIYIKAATYDKDNNIWIKPTFLDQLNIANFAVLTVICSVIATVLSVKEILGVRFTPPCYILPFLTYKNRTQLDADVLNCCGMFMNISKFNFQCGARS
ncbi:unnamed protein product [Brugia timori]|uniref:Aa_trans domain-containing protein n=1 Tax=Brugia timori TaxID=42155 RepID=A0A0R3QUR7_9BILA|nr:unnamed protein product [Brugia timori]